MSKFIIYDAGRERIGLLQDAESVQWLEHYQSPGEVKVVARLTEKNHEMLIDGNRIYNPDSTSVARISHVDIEDTEDGKRITARADITSELLSDRVVMATEKISNIEAAMYSIYAKNMRGMPIAAGAAQGLTESAEMELTWDTVLDAELKLADMSGLGFRVRLDPETGGETFEVYKGVDRSREEFPGYIGYFGTDVGNVKNITVSSGTTNYKNVAVVAGAGEGAARTVRIVSLGNPEGEERREMFVDARDLQREYQVATPTGQYDAQGNPTYNYTTKTYTETEYKALLDNRGFKALAEQPVDFLIVCDIEQNNVFFGEDYFLGDRMPVKLTEYGILASARISNVTMVYEKEGDRLVALLSDFELMEG